MRQPNRGLVAAVLTVILLTMFGGAVVRFASTIYTEHLWFQEVGYTRVFWTRNLAALGVRAIAGIISAVIIFLNLLFIVRRLGPARLRHRFGNLEIAEQVPRKNVMVSSVVVAILVASWLSVTQFGAGVPLKVWAWLHHVPWGSVDPLFHRDYSFYVFTLPVALLAIDHLLLTLFWSLILVAIGYVLVGGIRMQQGRAELEPGVRNHFSALAAAMLCVLALRLVMGRYAIVVNGTGVHGGIGYTDVHVRVLAQWVMAWLAVIAAASIVYGMRRSLIAPPIAGIGALVIGGMLFGGVIPAVVQRFRVQPNQLARETPYIQWNLTHTKEAFGVGDIARRHQAFTTATPATWAAAAPTLSHLALWDVDQLQDAFDQVQTFQGYYDFTDVDFDRYSLDGDVQQVGIGVREFEKDGLPTDSRNWFNLHRRPEFTRGVGVASARANTAVGGAPDYLVGEIAPIRVAPSASVMALTDPSVFFGELSNEYVVLGGDAGVPPKTGVAIGSNLRKFAFSSRFSDHNLLFTGNLDANSRLLFHRLVRERVEEVAPFVRWDRDALPVIAEGHVQWVLDGYTVSSSYPLSAQQPVTGFGSINYIHGSVKGVVDGVTGTIRLYATDAGDPILRSYAAMFPGLIRASAEMPAWLRAHLRYPATLLRVQASVLEQYHVEKLNAFFAGQDAWSVPEQGATRGTPRPDEPLNIMLQLDGNAPQYVSLLPFTARQRQNLTALLIAQNDSTSYGHLSLVDVTAQELIKGPAQIQSLIEQDPEISQQLSLWRQRGTDVELGQLRILPIANSILYVEPLFIAAEDKAIPQLHRVLVSDGANVVMAETLERAISLITARNGGAAVDLGSNVAGSNVGNAAPGGNANANAANLQRPAGSAAWPAEALRLYDQAEAQLRAGDFAAFGATWQKLRVVLQNAAKDSRSQR